MNKVDRQYSFRVCSISLNLFDHLLDLLKPKILKNNAVRAPIKPGERLAIALRFLTSGESWTSLNLF